LKTFQCRSPHTSKRQGGPAGGLMNGIHNTKPFRPWAGP
jgi:hypothetical protein